MIADASEAALRAAGSRNDAAQIVDRIIQERLQLGQFSDCDITMKELEIIKQTIISTYLGSQHERIRYPGQK
jgi:Predicted membrane-associated HD superfamily hydrolase